QRGSVRPVSGHHGRVFTSEGCGAGVQRAIDPSRRRSNRRAEREGPSLLGRADVRDRSQEAQMKNSLKHALQVCVAVCVAIVPMIAAGFMQHGGGPARVAVYASVGEELITFSADIERATLTKQSSIMLPGFVQEAWVSPSGPFLYVAWSNGGASYAGS